MKVKSRIASLMLNRIYLFISIFFLLVCFSSCNQKEIYYQYQELKNGKWDRSTELVFQLDSLTYDSFQLYNISLEIVHNSAYKYSDVWIGYLLESNLDSIKDKIKEKKFLIADDRGQWNGAGFGSSYQISFPLDKRVLFKKDSLRRNYVIRISHLMTDDPLVGIEKVGVKIEKND